MAVLEKQDIVIPVGKVEQALQREMSEPEKQRASQLIAQVIDAFEREAFGELANYGFGSGTVTQRIKSDGGTVYLPYLHAREVLAVTDDTGREVPYVWHEWQSQAIRTRTRHNDFLTVTYRWELTPGGATVDLLADAVARTMQIPASVRGGANQLTSSTGPFSQTTNFASWTVGGQALLSPEDKRAARAFRPRPRGRTWVMGS